MVGTWLAKSSMCCSWRAFKNKTERFMEQWEAENRETAILHRKGHHAEMVGGLKAFEPGNTCTVTLLITAAQQNCCEGCIHGRCKTGSSHVFSHHMTSRSLLAAFVVGKGTQSGDLFAVWGFASLHSPELAQWPKHNTGSTSTYE